MSSIRAHAPRFLPELALVLGALLFQGCSQSNFSWSNLSSCSSGACTGSASTSAASGNTLSIETAPDGTGFGVPSAISGSATVSMYAVLRSQSGAYLSNPSGSWALTGALGTLSTTSGGTSAFLPTNIGSGKIVASVGGLSASLPVTVSSRWSWIGAISSITGGWVTGSNWFEQYAAGLGMDGALDEPSFVTTDSTGNVYVSDSYNDRVCKLNAAGQLVGCIGYSLTAEGTCKAGAQTTWCLGGSFVDISSDGAFNSPGGLAVDASGNLYVANSGNARVDKYDSNGAFVGYIGNSNTGGGTCTASGKQTGWCAGGNLQPGTGDGMFSNPLGVALDISGNLYVVDSANMRVEKFASTGAFVGAIGKSNTAGTTCIVGSAQTAWCVGGAFASGTADGEFVSPLGVAVDSIGNVYVSDASSAKVQKFASTGAFVGAIGYSNAAGTNCVLHGAQTAWCVGGTFASHSGDGTFFSPYGLTLDGSNNLYVADTFAIQKFDNTGLLVGVVGYAASSTGTCVAPSKQSVWCKGGSFQETSSEGGFDVPAGIALDPSGNLIVSEFANNRLEKFSSAGAFAGAWGAALGKAQPGWGFTKTPVSGGGDGMWFSPSQGSPTPTGDLIVADPGNDRICKVSAASGAIAGCIGRATTPSGTCVAGAQSGWCLGGTFITGTGDGMFDNPAAATVDSSGNIYIVDTSNERIQKFTSSGAFVGAIGKSTGGGTCLTGTAQTSWCVGGAFTSGTADGMFSTPLAIAVDASGFLYIADADNNRIERFAASTGTFSGAIGKTTGGGGCAAGAAQTSWCSGGTFALGTKDGMFYNPRGIAVDGSGYIYVADTYNSRVQRISATTVSTAASIGYVGSSTGTCPSSGSVSGWCTGGAFEYATGDGTFTSVVGVAVDSLGNLYTSDFTGTISRFASSGAFTGWVGLIGVSPTSGDAGCAGAKSGSVTPGWCKGGNAAPAEQADIGGLVEQTSLFPGLLSVDGSGILYAADPGNHRILRIVP